MPGQAQSDPTFRVDFERTGATRSCLTTKIAPKLTAIPKAHCDEVGHYQGSLVLAMETVAASSRPWRRNCKKRLKSVAARRFSVHFQIDFQCFARKRQFN
jgi:hypothetical protein